MKWKGLQICSRCGPGALDQGDEPAPADYYVEGILDDPNLSRPIPYRGYVCADHLRLMESDGSRFHLKRELSNDARNRPRKVERNGCRANSAEIIHELSRGNLDEIAPAPPAPKSCTFRAANTSTKSAPAPPRRNHPRNTAREVGRFCGGAEDAEIIHESSHQNVHEMATAHCAPKSSTKTGIRTFTN